MATIKTWLSALPMTTRNIHDTVFERLHASSNNNWWTPARIPENEGKRHIQFTPNGQANLVLIRSNVEPPDDFPSKPIDYTVETGDKISLTVNLISQFNNIHKNKETKKKYANLRLMTHEEKMTLATTLLQKAGLQVNELSYTPNGAVICKNGYHQRIMLVKATAKIVDVQAFSDAILHGIGRLKTYGLGMITFSVI